MFKALKYTFNAFESTQLENSHDEYIYAIIDLVIFSTFSCHNFGPRGIGNFSKRSIQSAVLLLHYTFCHATPSLRST